MKGFVFLLYHFVHLLYAEYIMFTPKHPIIIAPSLLSADFAYLQKEVHNCEQSGADILHIDIMDGHFVPNITFGPMIVSAIRPHTSLVLDCHLMIENPDKYIPEFAKAGADWISVHVEASKHLHRTVHLIKEHGKKAGIVLNPATPIEYAYEAAHFADFILLMSVNPGFGGQKFIGNVLSKAKNLFTYLQKNNLSNVQLEIDGGVKLDNVQEIVNSGINILVSGSGLFSGDLSKNISEMKQKIATK